MTGRTHDLAAFTALAGVALVAPARSTSLATVLLTLLFNQIGGIAPDIDQPTAPFWKNLPIGKYFGKVSGKMLGGHRFFTHSLLGLIVTGFGMRLFLAFIHRLFPTVDTGLMWWGFMIGMVSHLVMDLFTKEGIPLLLPLHIKLGLPPIKSLRITTGKTPEKLLFLAIIAFDIWYFSHHHSQVQAVFHMIH